ncbi:response regulator [Aliikangiella sp. G2MR2-5]|uniref:response regulator n=1 Tax=Aliikangiella sp. G2MR2-5 TaxID=2788943 RepID=UPI0018A92C3C|nr:response regulator [Aliikangiella sp. G2MR2-5]
MSKNPSILVVDDNQDNRLLLKMLLEDEYSVSEADSGQACLEFVQESPPDLILLDVNMPGMSGYEVCMELKRNDATDLIPVIFVSALESTEERLAGFEAGASDYLTKPVDGEKLIEKVEHHLSLQQELLTAKKEASTAMNVAMEAMTSSSELGQIIQFVKNVQALDSKLEVAQAIINIAKDFGLNASAMVRGKNKVLVGCQIDSVEAKVLDRFQQSPERVTNLGIRTIILSENMVLLIKNMPLDDESRYGRLKDHLAVLEDIANGRLQTIKAQENVKAQKILIIQEVISLSEKQIKKTSEKIRNHSETVSQTMENMLNELENMLFSLGLDDDQEKKLMDLADRTSVKLTESNDDTTKLDSELGIILEALYELLEESRE